MRLQDFGGQLHPTSLTFNELDPITDAGRLREIFDPSNLFPVLMILVLSGGFITAWIVSLCIDRRNSRDIEELHRKHVLLFGEVLPGWGREEVGRSLWCIHWAYATVFLCRV